MKLLDHTAYTKQFKKIAECKCEGTCKCPYPHNDIGTAQLFYDLHKALIIYISEAKSWYYYDEKRWAPDVGGMYTSELCKRFVRAYVEYASKISGDFKEYVEKFHKLNQRKSLIADASTIAPKSISEFDSNPLLFNCTNGTYDLEKSEFRPHRPADYITKLSRVEYKEGASSKPWQIFINEIMMDNANVTGFLQKSHGYALSGDTSQECFFVNYGPKTRNGKSTLVDTISYLMGEYAATIQPQTLAKRSSNGATSSPDIARLQGIRFVNMPEPAKGLELDAALVKQLTGGDSVTARFLFKNFVEFKPAFKIFISTNHMPRIKDRTVFDSGRMKVIPFNRHFKPDEQNRNLKESFRNPSTMSGILNWLIEGYNAYKKDGRLIVPDEVKAKLKDFQKDATAEIDGFLEEILVKADGVRLRTSMIYKLHCEWAKEREFSPLSSQAFVAELRSRYEVTRDSAKGNVVVGYITKIDEFINEKFKTANGKLKVKDAYDSYCRSEKPVKLSAQIFDSILQARYEVKDDVIVGVVK